MSSLGPPAALAEKFKEYDSDGNGEISRAELKAFFKDLDPKKWTDRKIEQLLTAIDSSGDDQIQISEFVAWLWGARFDRAVGDLTLRLSSPFLLTSSQDGTAKIWSIETAQCWQSFSGHRGAVYSAQFSPDGKSVLTACEDGQARIWSVSRGITITRLVGHEAGVFSARFSHDGARVLTASFDGTARLWDVATAKPLQIIPGDKGKLRWAAFSPDGECAITASLDGCAKIWRLETGEQLQVFKDQHIGALYSAVFSADGLHVLTASKDGTAVIWKTETAEVSQILEGSCGGIFFAEFSVDGNFVVTAESGGTINLWSAISGEKLQSFAGSGQIASARFSPGNAGIATASDDGTIQIFGTQTGKCLRTFLGHDGPVTWVAWVPPEGASWPWAPATPLMRAISISDLGIESIEASTPHQTDCMPLESPLVFDHSERTDKLSLYDCETPLSVTLSTPLASRFHLF